MSLKSYKMNFGNTADEALEFAQTHVGKIGQALVVFLSRMKRKYTIHIIGYRAKLILNGITWGSRGTEHIRYLFKHILEVKDIPNFSEISVKARRYTIELCQYKELAEVLVQLYPHLFSKKHHKYALALFGINRNGYWWHTWLRNFVITDFHGKRYLLEQVMYKNLKRPHKIKIRKNITKQLIPKSYSKIKMKFHNRLTQLWTVVFEYTYNPIKMQRVIRIDKSHAKATREKMIKALKKYFGGMVWVSKKFFGKGYIKPRR